MRVAPPDPKKANYFPWEPADMDDESGTPVALLESAGRRRALLLVEAVGAREVLVEFPFGRGWQERTGCRRFVRLRDPIDGAVYALVRQPDMSPFDRDS